MDIKYLISSHLNEEPITVLKLYHQNVEDLVVGYVAAYEDTVFQFDIIETTTDSITFNLWDKDKFVHQAKVTFHEDGRFTVGYDGEEPIIEELPFDEGSKEGGL
jgi:hypothetical protein